MGGSAGIEQEYWKAGSGNQGGSSVTMTIMGESPMFQGMMRMFNPAIAGSTGGKLQKIKRNKAIVNYSADNRNGEIMINVDKKVFGNSQRFQFRKRRFDELRQSFGL